MSRPPTSTIYVGNLPFDITESALLDLLTTVGPVKNLRLVNDRDTGRFKGFGFCEYYDKPTAESAHRNLNGQEFNGRTLRIDYAEDFETKFRGPRNAGGGEGPGGSRPPLAPSSNQPGGSAPSSIGYSAASLSAQQVAALLGAPPASDRELQDQLNKLFATMSRAQLWEVMRLLRQAVTGDRAAARTFFLERPGLTKVIFQAQVLLGMVKAPSVAPPHHPGDPAAAPALGKQPGGGPGAAAVGPGGMLQGPPGAPGFAPAAVSFQEGPIGLGGPAPGGGGLSLQPPPPPPMRPAGGPLALQQPGGLPPRGPMLQQPVQMMITADGQQVMLQPGQLPPGMQPPPGMILQQQPAPGPPMQPQQLYAGPRGHLQQQPPPPPPMQPQQPLAPPPAAAAPGPPPPAPAPDTTKDLLRQVMVMTDEQINQLPEEYRNQVLYVKEQIRIGAIPMN